MLSKICMNYQLLPIYQVAILSSKIAQKPLLRDIRPMLKTIQTDSSKNIKYELQNQINIENGNSEFSKFYVESYFDVVNLYANRAKGREKDAEKEKQIKQMSCILSHIAFFALKKEVFRIANLRKKAEKSFTNLSLIVKTYENKHKGEKFSANSLAYSLGLYSCGYNGGNKNYLTRSLLLNECPANVKPYVPKYEKMTDNDLYLESQKEVKIILMAICDLLKGSHLRNSDISKLLNIGTYNYFENKDGLLTKQRVDMFSYSCLGILKKMGIISRYKDDKRYYILSQNYKNMIIPQPKIKKRNLGMSYASAHIETVLFSFVEQGLIDNWKREHTFSDCVNIKPLRFDWIIYVENRHYLIEYDGGQHFKMVPKFGEDSFESTKKNDEIKNNYCVKNGIYLLRIGYTEGARIKIHLQEFIQKIRNDELSSCYIIKKGTCYEKN